MADEGGHGAEEARVHGGMHAAMHVLLSVLSLPMGRMVCAASG